MRIKYKNVKQVIYYFSNQIQSAYKAGINDVTIDPGFDSVKQYLIMKFKNLKFFRNFDLPIMIGLSRKSMIYNKLGILQIKPKWINYLNTVALIKGANILRVHDVKEAKNGRFVVFDSF